MAQHNVSAFAAIFFFFMKTHSFKNSYHDLNFQFNMNVRSKSLCEHVHFTFKKLFFHIITCSDFFIPTPECIRLASNHVKFYHNHKLNCEWTHKFKGFNHAKKLLCYYQPATNVSFLSIIIPCKVIVFPESEQ